MHAEICARGVSERGVFVQTYGGSALDASLLLVPIMGFLPPDDERVRATVLAVADELSIDGLVLRYRPDKTAADADTIDAVRALWTGDDEGEDD